MRLVAALLFLLAIPAPAFSQGVRFSAIASTEVTLAGDVNASIRPAADLEVEGPLPIGDRSIALMSTRVRIFGLPGETVDLADVKTFRAAEVSLGIAKRVGAVSIGPQQVWTSLVGEWGFATVPGTDPEPALRYPRHYAVGLRFEERSGGGRLDLKLGRHEAAGVRGYGQLMLDGRVPLKEALGAQVLLGGDALLSVGPGSARAGQRDALRLWVGARWGSR